jgi:hypothetical protein
MVRPGFSPNSRSRRYSVERDIPSSTAARTLFPSHSRSAWTIASRSAVSSRLSGRGRREMA